MNRLLKLLFTFIICFYSLTHILLLIINDNFLYFTLSIFGLLSLFFALLSVEIKVTVIPVLLLLASTSINIIYYPTFQFSYLLEGVTQLSSLIVMLVFLPMIGWILKEKEYIKAIITLLKKYLFNERRFTFGVIFIIQMLSFFLLVGAIPLTLKILNSLFNNIKGDFIQKYINTLMLRGYALGTLWIISVPTLIYSIEITNASLSITIVQGFFMALLGIIIALLHSRIQQRKLKSNFAETLSIIQRESVVNFTKNNTYLLVELAVIFASLISMIFVFNIIFPLALLTIIPLVIFLCTFMYFLFNKKLNVLLSNFKNYLLVDLPYKAHEISIFLSAGTLLVTINSTSWGKVFFLNISSFNETIPFINLLIVLPLIILFLGYLGISPSTAIILIGGTITSLSLPYPAELLVLALTLGCVITFFLAPLTFPVIILSSVNKRTTWENSMKNNWGYACTFYIIVQVYIQVKLFYS